MKERLSRRQWLLLGAAACAASAVSGQTVLAQQSPYLKAAGCMAPMTGTPLAAPWDAPVAELVGIIVDDSKALRELELGEIEPATRFVPW